MNCQLSIVNEQLAPALAITNCNCQLSKVSNLDAKWGPFAEPQGDIRNLFSEYYH